MRFGERLRQERLRRHLSQEALAEALGVSAKSICRWEREQAVPQASVRLHLCRFFHLPPQDLFGDAELQLLPAYWQLPCPRNPFFIGREALLQHLHHLLSPQRNGSLSQTTALSGLGGIGKTATALEYAYRFFQEYQAVFWLAAETAEGLTSGFMTLAQTLGLPQEQEQSKAVGAVLRWLNTHAGWLLVYDNVEDLGLIKGLQPTARRGSLLFTTRLQTLGTLAACVEVEPLPVEEGMQMLLRRSGSLGLKTAGHQGSAEELKAAQALVEAMDGLPLALDQAAAYLQKTQSSVSQFLSLFQQFPVPLLYERDCGLEHPISVARTFALSFEQLQQTNPVAAELLTLCCFLAPEAIPERLLTQGASLLTPSLRAAASSPWRWNDLLSDLLAYSLLRRHPQTRTIMFHRLIQMVLKEGLPEAAQKEWACRVVLLMDQAFSLDQHTLNVEQWPWCEQVLPHVLLVIAQAARWQLTLPEYGSLVAKTATYFYQRARYAEAEKFYQRGLCLQEESLGPVHPELAGILTGLAHTYHQQGHYQESEIAYRRAVSLLEENLTSDGLSLT